VLRVDLFDIVDDVVIQRLAKQFVRTAKQSETELKQRRSRHQTFTTQHHQRLTECLQSTYHSLNANLSVSYPNE